MYLTVPRMVTAVFLPKSGEKQRFGSAKYKRKILQYNEIENTTAFTSDFGPQDLKRIDAASLKTPYF